MSQPSRADADSLPQTAAVGVAVVGRRAPTWETSAPTRSLNRLDLPLPVAPAGATTVRPPVIEVRAVVLAMAASARWTPSAGRQPAPDSRADRRAAALARTDSADTAPPDDSVFEAAPAPIFCGLIAPPRQRQRRL